MVESVTSVDDRSGRYAILGLLARTDLAELLLARVSGPEGFERHVVIKRLRAEHATDRGVVDMFVSEARLAATLHHQHIVQVTDIGEQDGVPYFAMEYVHGEDLRRVLACVHERSEQVPLPHVIAIGIAAATALHAAHEQKGTDGKSLEIVHRDVSPANILLGYDGNVKVVDFGIARATLRTAQTQTQMLRGKAPYMSPEQCSGKKLDRRSDVFSLGIVLYELVTCRRLFKASNEYLTMAAIVACQIPAPTSRRADLPKPLEDIILRALAREPAARYQSAQLMLEALDAVAVELGLRSTTTALASYAKQLFGDRPEPWRAPSVARPAVHLDFDGKGTGIAAPPAEALHAKVAPSAFKTKASPIEAARALALAAAPTTTSASPVVIPEGTARKDPTAPVELPERAKRVTRAPVPPPTRQRPKTIQIPSGTPRGDVTLAGVGIVRPPAAVGDVTISGTGVASTAPLATPAVDATLSGVGMVLPSSGFEPGGNTTEIVTALAVETTVDVAVPMPTASTVAAAGAVTAARKRSRSSGTNKVAEPAPPKGRGRSRSSGLSKAVVAAPIEVQSASAVGAVLEPEADARAGAPFEAESDAGTTVDAQPVAGAARAEGPSAARAEPARGAPRLSVMAFAARPREVSTLTPLVVPPSTTKLSAPIPVVPVETLDDNWDSSAFPAPPSATAFVPMGAGDAARIGPALSADELDSSDVLTPSFVGAVEELDEQNRSSTEIVKPLPPPRPSAPPGDAWANGEDDLDAWPPRRRWWPFAVAAGAAVLLVIVLAVALSGGKGKTDAAVGAASGESAPAPANEPATAAANGPAEPSDPMAAATVPSSSAPAASAQSAPNPAAPSDVAASAQSQPNSTAPATAATNPDPGAATQPMTAKVATSVQPSPSPTAPTVAKVATTAKQPTTSKVATTAKRPTTSKVATTAKQPTSKVATTAKQPTSKVATTAKPTTSKVATTAKPTTSKVATTAKQPTSKVATTAKQPTSKVAAAKQPTSKVATTAKQPTAKAATAKQPAASKTAAKPATAAKIATTAKQPAAKAATTKAVAKPPAAGAKKTPASTTKKPSPSTKSKK